ncbi:hypothetical protein BBJ28_00001113 [Nothophytophthora sp. Chile5]|nr:hypothetical protein BBJ28_00001113 [Nothophytophthora sp. Chile5]
MVHTRSSPNTTEFDLQPDPEVDGSGDTMSPPKQTYKIDLIQIVKFSGEIPDGFLDAGAGDWWNRLRINIRTAELANATPWPDEVKRSVVGLKLAGKAARWYVQNFGALDQLQFDQLGQALRDEFGCRLSAIEIGQELMKAVKRARESYEEYAYRLRVMAMADNNGEESRATLEAALIALIQGAWPQQRLALIGQTRRNSSDPLSQINNAIEWLTRASGYDGRKRTHPSTDNKENAHQQQFGKQSGDAKPKRTRAPAEGAKPPKQRRRDFSNEICDVCGIHGHETSYHQQWAARENARRSHGSARTAERVIERADDSDNTTETKAQVPTTDDQ